VGVATREQPLLIGGDWLGTEETRDVRSPYSDELVGRVSLGTAEHVRRAIDAAEDAMLEPIPAYERAAILDRVADRLEARLDEVARLICAEAGKPIKAARVEANRGVSTYRLSAVEARKLNGEMVPMEASEAGAGKLAFTIRRPTGVVAAITPFNFPLNLVAHKIAPALAAGCAVVLKPAAATPLSAFLLAELQLEAGLPPGWLNVVLAPAEIVGDVVTADPRIKVITFTGSGPVGWMLKERAPKKHVALELGNATPVIVEADADLSLAAAKLAGNAFSFAGQSCISVQRILVHHSRYDSFLAEFLAKVAQLKVGDPSDEETDVGPVIDKSAHDRILEWIEEARRSGARVLAGGDSDGGLIQPTVIADASPSLRISCEEVFGPVCTIGTYESLDEAVRLANSTKFGLQAGIFTSDIRAALRAVQELDFGGVTVNEAPTYRADQMPYGGVKESGNTKEGPAYAVEEFTEARLVVIQL
jgi:acyl-CoA reductase-like NAD-dependent aldehyde dehydrogenase